MDSSTSGSISILHLNINSITPKLELLKSDIHTFQPSVISIQETKLSPSSHLDLPGYNIFRKDLSKVQGGILLAVKNNIPAVNITDNAFDHLQFLEILIPNKNSDIKIITYYIILLKLPCLSRLSSAVKIKTQFSSVT